MSHKHQSDQRGVAHLLLIVIVVVVVAAVGYVGWKVAGNKKSSSSSSNVPAASKQVASAAETACLGKYHDKDLCKFVAAEEATPFEKTSLKVTMTGTSGGTQGTWYLEQDGKGNDSVNLSGGGQTMNVITYAGQSYMQTEANGPWVTYGAASSSSSNSQSSTPDSSLTDFANSLSTTTYTKIGKEACGSQTCLKYKVADASMPNSTQYVWFDTKHHLMRQYFESDSSTGDSLTMTISYQKVTISKPSPVQDLSAGAGAPAAQ